MNHTYREAPYKRFRLALSDKSDCRIAVSLETDSSQRMDIQHQASEPGVAGWAIQWSHWRLRGGSLDGASRIFEQMRRKHALFNGTTLFGIRLAPLMQLTIGIHRIGSACMDALLNPRS